MIALALALVTTSTTPALGCGPGLTARECQLTQDADLFLTQFERCEARREGAEHRASQCSERLERIEVPAPAPAPEGWSPTVVIIVGGLALVGAFVGGLALGLND